MAVTFSLPRSLAWIGTQAEPGVQARTLVDERFDAVAAMVGDAKTDFDASIEAMNNSLSPIAVNALSVEGIDIPDLGGDIPDFTGTFDKVFTATLDEFDVSYIEPEGKPDSTGVVWEDTTISLETELIGKLAVWLSDGETALPNALVTQIYNSAELQLDEKRAEAISIEESKTASRGFDIPAGVAANRVVQIEREYGKAAAELSASIANRNTELTQANFHKAIEIAERYIAAARDYNIKKNLAKIQWYSEAVRAWVSQVDAAIKVIDAEVAAFRGKVEAYTAQATVYKTEADVFDSTVRAYAALVDGLKTKYQTVAMGLDLQIKAFQVETTAAIEEEKLNVEAQKANQSLAQRIAEAQSNLHAQVMSSGLSAMHVQASISSSHSTGQDVSYSYSYGEQMSEQHSESQSTSINAEV